ncbi:hypothetical protein [Flagellimonas myxillae]|uniref:hypothetical protein n=1 Tax=Flagellimonas myxillae TaxID=2942214 RepID=UPI00201F891D|nr:hypothetical protein [Muricauda myxillae]MCL6265138.1 hypothetical protein [Muricauda myxillae]
MIEEFQHFLEDSYNIVLYLITWFVAMYRYRSYFDTVLRFFPIFIMYTFLTELLGYFVKNYEEFQFFSDSRYTWHNVIIYNIYSVVSFAFFYYIYWVVLKNNTHKKWLKYAALFSLISYLVSLFFQDPFHTGLYYADLVASMVLLFCIWMYFKEKKTEDNPYPQKRNLLFWISLGLAIFHIFFPFVFIAAYDAPGFYARFQLHDWLMGFIVIMYILFIIGFLMGKRQAFR